MVWKIAIIILSDGTDTRQRITGIPRDPPLAAFGERQAQELKDYFCSLPDQLRPTTILSSPYYRCLQTAQPVSRALHIPIYVDHGIAEWYSPVMQGTGLHPRPSPASALKVYFSGIDPSWESLWYPPRTGEDVQQVHDRIDGFLDAFFVQSRSTSTRNLSRVLFVGHAATVIVLARSLLGNRDLPLRVGCCSLSEFVLELPKKTWRAVRLADCTHLKEGSLREWGFEDIETIDGKVIEIPGIPGTELDLDRESPVGLQHPPCSHL